VNATTVQPGTRCECRIQENEVYSREHFMAHQHAGSAMHHCQRDAVRLVNVTPGAVRLGEHIPMCEPCAAYHEQKAGER
jgi:hypothetical protein